MIKIKLHEYEIHRNETTFRPLKQVLRDAIAKLSKTTRGHASLYSYRKRIEMEQK